MGIDIAIDSTGNEEEIDHSQNDARIPLVHVDSNSTINTSSQTATPTVYGITITGSNTEYSLAFPVNTRGFEFQAEEEALLRFQFVTGKVATPTAPYFTLKAGDYYFSPVINQSVPSTLYVASPTAGTHVQVLIWT